MRAVILRSLAVIGVGAAILVGVLYVASTVDARAPEVLAVRVTQPLGDDPGRALITTSLEIAFSEPVEASSAERALRLDPSVDGSVSWSGSTMIFTPAEPLALDTEYALRVEDGVRDRAGNEMTTLPPAFTFRTAGRPQVVATQPEDAASGVALDEPIGLTFSTLMDTVSVESALRVRPTFPHDVRWSGEVLKIVPTAPLRAGTEYVVRVGSEAADIAGVTLGSPMEIRFRTVEAGLRVETIVPADGIDGIAPTSPIAVVFDRPVDPDSVSPDLLRLTPSVAGALEVVPLPGEPPADDGSGRVLRFTPSGPLPSNTTFDVQLLAGVVATSGGGLADGLSWTFTTGAPTSTLSNQIVFLTDRAGVPNLWSMNPDGTGQRQLSTELAPVLDYAVAPDGSSFVVADGRRLIFTRADGGDRRVLSVPEAIDFDPSYAPDSARIAYARMDVASGAPLGLWEWVVGGGDPEPIELASEPASGASPSPDDEPARLRAPRYSPDGAALAYVDADGSVGILHLADDRVEAASFHATRPPAWLADGSGVLLAGEEEGTESRWPTAGPMEPLHETGSVVVVLRPGDEGVAAVPQGSAVAVAAVASDGRVATLDPDGALRVAAGAAAAARTVPGLAGERVTGASFAPGEDDVLVVAVAATQDEPEVGSIERIDLADGQRTVLARRGWAPRWLP